MIVVTAQHENTSAITPFLKWAGGKRWLVSAHSDVFPREYNRYIEPFLGSGAVFFHLRPKCGVLSDKNPALIDTYDTIKTDWKKIQAALRRYAVCHEHNYYYEERDRRRLRKHTRAAQFIYLNRTCWNGLYRVNLNGKFNVPIGTKDAVCLPTDDFEEISKILQNFTLRASDFEVVIDAANPGDFIFADPPYTVKHNVNGFVKYNEHIFSWEDQVRLRDALVRATDRGALISLTNADHESVRNLYEGFLVMEPLSRNSVLAGKVSARSPNTELLIRNWV